MVHQSHENRYLKRIKSSLSLPMLNQIITYLFLAIISFYQKGISPLIPARCRYYPTCSCYGQQAIRWHGAWWGGWLAIKRIVRCHPFGGHGIDFVPLPLYRYHYHYVCSSYPLNKTGKFSNQRYVSREIINKSNNVPHGTILTNQNVYQARHDYNARLNHLIR